jgi:peroxiredoxin family protein
MAIVTEAPSLAAVLACGEPERLYSALSLLVSTASESKPCLGLATFRALALMLDAEGAADTAELPPDGRERFRRSLAELIETARELDTIRLYACSASVEAMSVTTEQVESRLDGVMSTPRFLRVADGARLIFV